MFLRSELADLLDHSITLLVLCYINFKSKVFAGRLNEHSEACHQLLIQERAKQE